MVAPDSPQTAAARAPRQDGQATRQQILEVAGRLFAEQGYANTTSKQICENSRANNASVNYHFENKDGLYQAVLREAHDRLLRIETMIRLSESQDSAENKLRAIITVLIEGLGNERDGWALKVMTRELVSPSSVLSQVLEEQAFPKAKIVRTILGQIMQLSPDDPATLRSAVSVFSPCLFLLIAHDPLERNVLPGLKLDPPALIEHMMCYALAGLQAVSRITKAG
ncbi:MAG: TetR/AcrR family transcriptional regulator [Pseudomonas sp.]|uniref:TetR/AcrR family transcriptional regulator n=1 Tax=unclassified Pseudomonas TaxID=196821 RepID=UPI000731390B|nr:TetR/AcrR family transcriptional regulator [Pseudomonas sp. L5B5]KTC33270.1 2,4-diacetylphloroglucinol biosynthesis protein [Pseudomonas sp. ABAC61]UCZ82746.1 CerR family C-terminal domain-containing protein [Pseudomonas sp. L5B5]